MIEVRKMKITMSHRRKKNLCEKCGKYEINSKHVCLENYLCADTRKSTDEDIFKAHTEFNDSSVPEKKPVATIKEIKEKLMPKPEPVKKIETIEKKEIKQLVITEPSISKNIFLQYVVIENLTNYMDFDFINFMSKYYHNRYYFILLVKNDFINSLPHNLINIHKLINVHVKNIETEDINLNKLLEDSKCIFTNNQKIIQCCEDMKHNYVVMPDKVTIESIKSNQSYWEIK